MGPRECNKKNHTESEAENEAGRQIPDFLVL